MMMGLCDDLRLVEVNQKRTENKFRTKSTKKKKQRTKFPELSAAHAFTRAHCAQCARNEPVRTMRTGNNLDAHEMVDMLLARARAPILYKYSSVLTIVCVGPWDVSCTFWNAFRTLFNIVDILLQYYCTTIYVVQADFFTKLPKKKK